MPLTGAEYQQRSQEEILAFLEAELRAEFGKDIDLTQSSAFRTFATAVSGVDSEDIEPALQKVHDAAFLERAEGELLEQLVAILGIERQSAIHATGTVEFRHGGTVKTTYTVDNGTVVQTDSSGDPVEFETTELVTLSFFDDFEEGSLRSQYGGQTADFSVVDGSASGDPTPTDGSFELRSAAVSGSKVFVDAKQTEIGDSFDFRVYLQNSTTTAAVAGNVFGLQDADNYYRTKLTQGGGHAIEKVTSSGATTLQSSTASMPAGEWLRNEVEWLPDDNGTITSKVYDSAGNLVDEITTTGVGDDISVGGFGFESLDGSENKYWDHSGQRAAVANIRARDAGTSGNVGANTLTTMPTVPSGVNSVTNRYPTGDDSHFLTNLLQFTAGAPRESDEQLRQRATRSEGSLGRATVPAVIAAATALDGAESVTVFENKTNNDNTGSGGLPPKSFELVFYGTTPNQKVADMLHEVRAVTARDYGGAHGTEVSETVEAENGQTLTMNWSEPTDLAVDMTLDIVVEDDYIGDDALRERIVEYVGGTLPDGTSTLGTGVGEDVYVDQIEDVVTGPDDTGVIGISSYSFTPSTTTDGNGLEVVSVGSNEVASTNGEDGSITLNVTKV